VHRLGSTRVLVTGGTSGIGAAVVERLREDGASVVLTGRDRARGDEVAHRTGSTFVAADVRDPAAVRGSVEAAAAALGGLDGVVLNAGVLHEGSLSETPDEAWDAVMDVNLMGPYRYALACLPHLRAAGGGSIVAVSSDAGAWVETAIGAYSVSKRALITLAQMLGTEAGKDGIRVNVVCRRLPRRHGARNVDVHLRPGRA
jgi:NAD(P)-dependent dehydrogenase (short-subunit alcohol dehydrogenase family)